MGFKNNLYWREEQDADMKTMFTTENTSKEWYLAYKRTLPRLKIMGIAILRKYFKVQDEKIVQDMVMDAITYLLIGGSYNPDKPKMYSYCGTVIKRYFIDVLLKPTNRKYHGIVDDNYDINTDVWIADDAALEPDFEDFDYTEREEMYDKLIKICDEGIEKNEGINDRRVNRNNHDKLQEIILNNRQKEIDFLSTVKIYFEKYFHTGGMSSLSMAEYVFDNTDLKSSKIMQLQRRYFNSGSDITKAMNLDYANKCEAHDISYLMDDYTPMRKEHGRERIKSRRKRNGGSQYEYF